jgi:hypothetical protein
MVEMMVGRIEGWSSPMSANDGDVRLISDVTNDVRWLTVTRGTLVARGEGGE